MNRVFLTCLFLLAAGSASVRAGTIEGSVRDLSGKSIAEATVYALNSVRARGPRRRITATSDSEGRFALRDIQPGNYEVHAYKDSDGYPDTFFAFFGINKKAFREAAVSERSTVNVVLELGPKCARLVLSIRGSEGNAIGGGLTFARVAAPDALYSVGVNSESDLLVPPVPFRFEVTAKGYQLWQSKILDPRSGETIEVTVSLTRSP